MESTNNNQTVFDRGFGGRFIKGKKKKRKRNTNESNMMQPPSITVGNQDLRPRDRSNSAPTTRKLSIMRPPSPTINNNSNIALKPRGRSNSDPTNSSPRVHRVKNSDRVSRSMSRSSSRSASRSMSRERGKRRSRSPSPFAWELREDMDKIAQICEAFMKNVLLMNEVKYENFNLLVTELITKVKYAKMHFQSSTLRYEQVRTIRDPANTGRKKRELKQVKALFNLMQKCNIRKHSAIPSFRDFMHLVRRAEGSKNLKMDQRLGWAWGHMAGSKKEVSIPRENQKRIKYLPILSMDNIDKNIRNNNVLLIFFLYGGAMVLCCI